MGLESASMRWCLLWYNFIVRGMRTVGPKTQTDPWYGGFSIIFETVTCACACVCKLNILFFFLFCVSPSSPSEEVKQRGSPVADDANISLFINRINYAIIRTATLTPSGFMYTGSNNFTTLSASPQQKQLHICRGKKHCRKSTVSTKSASFLSIETRFLLSTSYISSHSIFFMSCWGLLGYLLWACQ